ncbi:MAG: pyridoxamine 5'-phosphate oxidase family protein, partial [Acidimicrobiales bacterium]
MSATSTASSAARPTPRLVTRALHRRSVAVLATVSAAGRPHAATVVFCAVDHQLYVSTLRSSRKGRNLDQNPWVGVVVPVRRLPVGPPSSIQFQGRAEVLDPDDDEITRLVDAGELTAITGHGELELPDGCFVRITPVGPIHTYGLGLSLRRLIRDPLNAGGSVE